MEKKWLLRLPKDLDDWLTLRAAEETVSRGKRISKNTLIIELATSAREAKPFDPPAQSVEGESWQDAKSALEFIQMILETKAEAGSAVNDRIRQRMAVNLQLLASYLEDLEE